MASLGLLGVRRVPACIGAVVALSALLSTRAAWAGEPSASDKDTARALMGNANKAYGDQDYKHALEYFTGADSIMHLPTTGLGVMRSQEKLGLLVEARDTALAIGRIPAKTDESGPDQEARKEAAKLAAEIEPRIPTITIQPSGLAAGVKATIVVDGETLPAAAALAPRKVDPGKHSISGTAPGYEDGKADITINEGENQNVPLALKAIPGWKPPAPPPSAPSGPTGPVETKKPIHPLLWAGIATTAVGLVVGGSAGGYALAKGKGCKNAGRTCPEAAAATSDVGFGVAGVGAILCIVAIPLSTGTTTTAPKTGLFIGPSFTGVEGSF